MKLKHHKQVGHIMKNLLVLEEKVGSHLQGEGQANKRDGYFAGKPLKSGWICILEKLISQSAWKADIQLLIRKK